MQWWYHLFKITNRGISLHDQRYSDPAQPTNPKVQPTYLSTSKINHKYGYKTAQTPSLIVSSHQYRARGRIHPDIQDHQFQASKTRPHHKLPCMVRVPGKRNAAWDARGMLLPIIQNTRRRTYRGNCSQASKIRTAAQVRQARGLQETPCLALPRLKTG